MHVLSLACLVMASVNFYVAAYYLFFFIKRPQIKEHLPFSLLCLAVGLYDIFCMGLYNSRSLDEGMFWQRLQYDMVGVVAVFLIWFSAVFTKQQSNKILRFSVLWFLVLFAASPVVDPRFTLSPGRPAVKHISAFGLPPITYFEGAVGLLYQIEVVSAVCFFSYLGYLFFIRYKKTHYRTFLLVLLCLAVYFGGVLNDSLVSLQAYSFFYISEYSFFFVIMAMAYVLFDNFVNLHRNFEKLNITLEQKVYDRTREVEKLTGDLKRLSDHDPLTGVYNRRFFNEYFDIEMKRASSRREHQARLSPDADGDMHFGLAVIDIDHFRLINDTYGHVTGDSVLMQVIALIQENMFARDVLCRYGGDEFVLILTQTSRRGIHQAAEKIRREIDEHAFIFGKGLPRQHVTVSMGIVSFEEIMNMGHGEALKLMDDRLQMSKIAGRNRIAYGDASVEG
jgi:diguanylate cyclase (GGDEF)-like protein